MHEERQHRNLFAECQRSGSICDPTKARELVFPASLQGHLDAVSNFTLQLRVGSTQWPVAAELLTAASSLSRLSQRLLATMDEDSESGRGKEFLKVSVPPRAIPPYPTSHSSQLARVINTLGFGKGTSKRGGCSRAELG